MSPTSRSWRAVSATSSPLMPLTSRSRITARPPMARPSASTDLPPSVVSVMAKPSPTARSFSTECLDQLRLIGRQPRTEGQHALRHGRLRHDRHVADNVRFVGAGRPGHHDLRLREEQCVDAVGFGGQRVDLAARFGLVRSRALARAHQHDRGDDRKQHDAERQCERRKFMTFKTCECTEIKIDRHVIGGRRGRCGGGPQRAGRGKPSASQRIGAADDAGRPNHSRIPIAPNIGVAGRKVR